MMKLRLGRPVVLNTWVNASRIRNKLTPEKRDFLVDLHAWLDENARGRSFADIGGMWGDLWAAFDAEARGAGPVTMLDVSPPNDACTEEARRRGGSAVRFVRGDVHARAAREEVGKHDIVMCSGVLYHCPHPLQTLACLREITSETLLFGGATIAEIPGFPQGCIFYPMLSEPDRLAIAAPLRGAMALNTPFDPDPTDVYGAWWWGISRSALRAMFAVTGWEIVEERHYRWPPGYRSWVVARPTARPDFAGLAATAAMTGS